MRVLRILFFKELKSYVLAPFGWVILAFTMVMQALSLSTTLKLFHGGPVKENLLYVVFHTPYFWFYFLFIFPLITMRLFSEEEKTGTLEGLLTAPINTWQIVSAKFLAAFSFYSILWIPVYLHLQIFAFAVDTPIMPWTGGAVFGTWAILMLMGALFTAFGCLASALTPNQIVAGILTIGMLLIQFFLGYASVFWGKFEAAHAFDYIASQHHLDRFARGLIDTRPLAYYFSMTLFILLLTHHIVDYRRWKS